MDWFLTKNTPYGGTLLELCRDWPRPIPEVIAGTRSTLRNEIADRPPLTYWGKGNVTLLGDAAHSTTPNLGQGACMALEDAVVLADCLRRYNSIEAGLREYERLRIPRTTMVNRESWRMGRLLQLEHPLAERVRDWASATPVADYLARRLFRELLTYNLPSLV